MKNASTARPRTIALLMAATVLPATPLFAQEAASPPPVAATVPPPEAPAAPPAVAAPASAPAPVFAPRAEVVQPLPVRPAPAPEAVADAPAPRAATPRSAPRPRTVSTPVAAAPVTAPVAVTPAPVIPPVATPEPAAPVATTTPEMLPVTPDTAQTSTTTTTTQTPWMWIGGGLVALGAILALLFGRRRRPVDEVVYDEPIYVAPTVAEVPIVEPVAEVPVYTPPVAPKTATQVSDEERPWIGLSLQATGTNARGENDLVEYNLIVENAGEVLAHDVRVSTFLIDGRVKSSDSESALIDAVGETQSRFIDLAPGTSVPIASTLSVPHGVDPCIIAEAHYPLPGGGEGHIAARFVIEGGAGDTVEARLDDVLERV